MVGKIEFFSRFGWEVGDGKWSDSRAESIMERRKERNAGAKLPTEAGATERKGATRG